MCYSLNHALFPSVINTGETVLNSQTYLKAFPLFQLIHISGKNLTAIAVNQRTIEFFVLIH